MNREIKFRGKRTSNGKWIYGAYIPAADGGMPRIYDPQTDEFDEIKPGTEGQYAGLEDRKGVEIFEGDVIQDGRKNGYRGACVVVFHNGRFQVDLSDPRRWTRKRTGFASWSDKEVIGNIYENPNLLTQ